MNLKRITSTFVRQQDHSDCGVACLASVVNFHNGETHLEHLRRITGATKQGTTLLGLMQAAQQLGFEAIGLEADGIHNLNELVAPAILHVLIDKRTQHYLVFYGFEDEKIIVGDPARGIVRFSNEELLNMWQSKALLKITPNKDFEKKDEKRNKKRKWFIELIKEDIGLLLVSLSLGIVISILGITTAIFSQKLIDEILPKGNTQKLVLSLVLVFVLLAAKSGINYLRSFFMIRQGMDFNNRIIQSFYGNLLLLPKSFFDTRKTGDLVARLNDTRRIQNTVSALTGSIMIDLLLIAVSIFFLFSYSAIVGFGAIGLLLIYCIILASFNSPIIALQKEVMGSYALTESNFVDAVQGIADIKISNKISFFEKMNKSIYEFFQKRNFELGKLSLQFSLITEVAGVAFIISVFALSSWLVLSKELLLGEMMALISMAVAIIPSATRLVIANIQFQEARIAFDRMFEFAGIEKENFKEVERSDNSFSDLEIRNVSFRFPGRRQILKDVSLTIKRGEIIALLGESGCGKSTLFQLIQRFYRVESGDIFLNKEKFEEMGLTELRNQIGSVPQDLKIFNGNLLLNITLSDQPDDFKKAITLCEEFGLDKYFKSFPQSYLTLLGEEGVNISGGQKQLVVLARALFRKPKLLLLDESTSAMDRNTENFILALLQKLKLEMGILLVTHRIKTAQRCDRIYILENGIIASTGTPKELMLSDNFYSDSYRELISE